MKTIKLLSLISLLFMLTSNAVSAQKNEDPKSYEHLKKELKLNEKQYKKLQKAEWSFHDREKAIKESGASKEEQKVQLKALHDEKKNHLKSFLSKEQVDKYYEMQVKEEQEKVKK